MPQHRFGFLLGVYIKNIKGIARQHAFLICCYCRFSRSHVKCVLTLEGINFICSFNQRIKHAKREKAEYCV
jgi:hypothetical protein